MKWMWGGCAASSGARLLLPALPVPPLVLSSALRAPMEGSPWLRRASSARVRWGSRSGGRVRGAMGPFRKGEG